MKHIDDYFNAKQKVHEYFNYTTDWKEIPMEDGRKYYWMLVGSEESGTLVYSQVPIIEEDLGSSGGNFYTAVIYAQRFLKKYVYKTDEHTMMSIDTRTDGNKFLIILDNKLECKDDSLKKVYKKYWG